MSDKIVVMNKGRIEQEGSPEEVYSQPRSEFVARFLGNSNLLDGTVTARNGASVRVEVGGLGSLEARINGGAVPQDGEPVRLVVRAEKLHLSTEGAEAPGATQMNGRVDTVDYQGQAARYFVTVGDHSLQVINPIDRHPLPEGAEVNVRVRPQDIVLLAPEA